MEFLQTDLDYVEEGSVVCMTFDTQANVLLLDTMGLINYKAGSNFSYYGGLANYSPVRITVPYSGVWYVVIDLTNVGGYGSIRSSVSVELSESVSGLGITEGERRQILREIRDREDALEAFRETHPRDKIRIREMEDRIQGLKNYLKGSHG